jgi:negative regulator of flagellin synthesis FlgM
MTSPGKSDGKAQARPAAPAVERSAAFDPGAAPVDAERVAVIRKAVEQGSYPVIPARIADAMIAAGMLLRSTGQ